MSEVLQKGNNTPAQKRSNQLVNKKIKAIKLIKDKHYTKSEACREVGLARLTLDRYIAKIINNYKQLSPDKRISYWESESMRDRQLAGIVRDKLLEDMELSSESISPSEKRAIYYSASMCAGLAWDKAHPPKEPIVGVQVSFAQLVRQASRKTQDVTDKQEGGDVACIPEK